MAEALELEGLAALRVISSGVTERGNMHGWGLCM